MWCGVSRRWIQVLPQLLICTFCDSVYHIFPMVFEILISESEPTVARSFWLPLHQQMVKKATPKPSGKSWITSCERCHLENVTLTEEKVLLLHSLCFCMCFRANSNIKCLLQKEQFISLNTFFDRPRLFIHFRTKKWYSIEAESSCHFVMQMTVMYLSLLKSQQKKGHWLMLKPQEIINFLITTAMQLYTYLRLLLLDTFL